MDKQTDRQADWQTDRQQYAGGSEERSPRPTCRVGSFLQISEAVRRRSTPGEVYPLYRGGVDFHSPLMSCSLAV